VTTSLDCIPCFLRQALEAARLTTSNVDVQEEILSYALRMAAEMDMRKPPPIFGQGFHRQLLHITGVSDPYRSAKDRFNMMALAMLPELSAKVERAPDPLMMAVRLSIAGNIIDMGVNGNITEAEVRRSIERTLWEPLVGNIEELREEVGQAKSILYLADNAGEIVFDRLLLEQFPLGGLTLVVRGGPVINDATLVDAQTAGLDKIVGVIDNGSDAPGTILSDCSLKFRHRFTQADLIIAKGQGNFETLSSENANMFFLFKVKCPVVSAQVGLQVGTHVMIHKKGLVSQ
jgi:damage-control phosphatase, subfamily I